MIEFNCPHCQNAFSVPDELSGRDGWCRVCKHMIVIQDSHGAQPGINDLPLEERYARLDKLMQYAAGRADNFKLLLNAYRDENGGLIPSRLLSSDNEQHQVMRDHLDNAELQNKQRDEELTDVNKQRDALEADKKKLCLELENSLAEARDTESTPTAITLEENLKKAETKIVTLSAGLEEETHARSQAENDRNTLDDKIEQIQADLDAVSDARADSELQRNEMAETIQCLEGDLAAGAERIMALSQEIVSLQAELEASKRVEEEVMSLTKELAELNILQAESNSEKESLIDQIAEMRAEANKLRHQIDTLGTANIVYSAQPIVGLVPQESENGKSGQTNHADTNLIEVAATPPPQPDDVQETETPDGETPTESASIMDSYLNFLKSR